MIARKVFADALRPLLPKGWQLVDGSRSVDVTKKTVVLIRQASIRPHRAAPIGYHEVSLVVNIRIPEQSTEAAEDRLDAEVDDLGNTIRALRDRFGLTVLLVEHHMQLVMGISDKVVVLDFGRKIAEGTPAEVQNDPVVVKAYLGEDFEVA